MHISPVLNASSTVLILSVVCLFSCRTSIINLNYEHYMFDGGLPSLPCLTADSNHKPTLEYSSQNHNNEMLLFCSGTNTSPVSREEGVLSFSDIFFSGAGDRDKKPIELICESMKMSPFLRQPQVGGLDSFELQYNIKEFGQTGPAQSVKVSSRPTSSLSSTRTGGSLLLQSALQPKMGSRSNLLMLQDSQWIEEMLPADVAVKLCSDEAQDGEFLSSTMCQTLTHFRSTKDEMMKQILLILSMFPTSFFLLCSSHGVAYGTLYCTSVSLLVVLHAFPFQS